MKAGGARPRRSTSRARAAQPWSSEEDLRLENAYRRNEDTRKLAVAHQRTRGAIRSRLLYLGLELSGADNKGDFATD